MLKKQGIATLLFLFTSLFLFTADISFLINNPAAADSSFQRGESDANSAANNSAQPFKSPSQSVESDSQSILSTSYKRYSLFRYYDLYILCEPYTVKPKEWVYKIFRSKGELSKEDFGLFMRIFKSANPQIKDVNSIKVGQTIIIPLKKSRQNDFKESHPGVVELPVITLYKLSDSSNRVKRPMSEKISLRNDTHINNGIYSKYSGISIKQSNKIKYSEIPVRNLKQFATLNNGQLKLRGKYYFPRNNGDDLVIDVALNPIVQLNNGSKILFVPERDRFADVADTIREFWHDFKIMEFKDVTTSSYEPLMESQARVNSSSDDQPATFTEQPEDGYVPVNVMVGQDHKDAVKQLLEVTGYKYTPEKEISLPIGSITVRATPGIISRDGRPDILVVFGDIYGSAFEALKKIQQGNIIITISPLLTSMDVAKKIFSALGASTTDNPSFVNPADGKTISIDGLYVKCDSKDIFITQKPSLIKEAFRYLSDKNIPILRVYSSL